MFLLDTNVVSELRKGRAGTANPGVVDWAEDVPPALLFLSVISVQELERGVLLAERRDAAKGAVLRGWLESAVVPAFEGRTLPIDLEVARRAARLNVSNPAPIHDGLIAATAIVHGLVIVTRNIRDFQRFERLEVLNPWT